MPPATHFMLSWVCADLCSSQQQHRRWATWAGIIPDVDGVVIVVDAWINWTGGSSNLYGTYHHVWGHNLLLGIGFAVLAGWRCAWSWRVMALCLLCFHLHLLGDLLGSGGPQGDIWGISYGWPFTASELHWHDQWALNAWPNRLIGVGLLLWALWRSWWRGHSPLEAIHRRLDDSFIASLYRRWPRSTTVDQQ